MFQRWLLWFGLGLSVIGTLFSFFALVMVGSFATQPNYSQARLDYNMTLWTTAIFAFGAATLLCSGLIVNSYIRRRRK